MNPLLKNAVVSIQLGLEDFASEDERRVISAARNLYSGVLLIAKEVLRQLSAPGSNEVLIRTKKKAVKDADGTISFVGEGKKTIDRFEIEEAFKQLELAVDLSNLKRLAAIRNDIEHMHPQHAPALIQEAIADAMPIIRDVIVNELQLKPSTLLGQTAWDALLDQAKVFKSEQDACQTSFKMIDWENDTLEDAVKEFRCPNCSASLLRNDNPDAKNANELRLICSKCGDEADREIVIEAAIEEHFATDVYLSVKEGDDPPLENCPECGRNTYIIVDGRCANPDCDFSLNGYECAICSEGLTLDDYRFGDGSLCSYHAYVILKDD